MLTEGIEGKSLDQCCSKNGDIESQSVVPTVLLANRHRKGTILVGVSDLTCTLFLKLRRHCRQGRALRLETPGRILAEENAVGLSCVRATNRAGVALSPSRLRWQSMRQRAPQIQCGGW